MKKLVSIIYLLLFINISNAQKIDDDDVETNGLTSELHKKYLNKIVFTSLEKDILLKEENETAFKTSFVLGQPIYFRVYMDNSMSNYLKRNFPLENRSLLDQNGIYIGKIFLDGVEVVSDHLCSEKAFSESDKQKFTTFRGALKPNNEEKFVGTYIFQQFLTAANDKLSVGEHNVKLEVYPYVWDEQPKDMNSSIIASGEFKLSVKANSIDPNDPNICYPKTVMHDKELEESIAKNYLESSVKPSKAFAIILDDEWTILRHPVSGIIVAREIHTAVVYQKDSECYYEKVVYKQNYDGKNYSKKVIANGTLGNYKIPCGCLQGK